MMSQTTVGHTTNAKESGTPFFAVKPTMSDGLAEAHMIRLRASLRPRRRREAENECCYVIRARIIGSWRTCKLRYKCFNLRGGYGLDGCKGAEVHEPMSQHGEMVRSRS